MIVIYGRALSHSTVLISAVDGRRLRLLEVKWSQQLRPEELKEIRRRGRGLIACRVQQAGQIDGVGVLPAAVVLLRLAAAG